ncbi:MAG: hypothetical protein K6E54_11440 [Bacteroidaceae bacterium]|nr:hypothetical protein [Bacteroidaceae bacterium]
MKNIIKNIAICGCVTLGLGLASCEDMMTVDTGDKAYTNANDTLYSYLGIMRAMQDVAERQVILGEIRGDLVSSTDYTTDTLYAISNFDDPKDQSCSMLQVSDYYNVINNCNFYIHNCDTSAVKSNIKYMLPEYTQVKAVRAWAYLQLVKNYKEVPYITEPVSNLDVIKNFDYNNNLVNKDNLIDKFIEDGLLNMVNTRYPQYGNTKNTWGNWDNGNINISARLLYIPIRVVLADAYLLRGQNETDYINAAKYYYDYLKNETTPMPKDYCLAYNNIRTGSNTYNYYYMWGQWADVYVYNETSNEVITTIPSSSNAGFGKILTRVADIYGYKPSSSQSTNETTETNDNGDLEGTGEYETSGAISVTPTYKRQYGPSNAYNDVNNDQTYVKYTNTTSSSPTISYIENCDARYGNATQNLTYEGDAYPLCAKAARSTSFYYCIPIYRKTLIWLRLAEAINRAGYPEFAFAILKDGLNEFTLPTIATKYTTSNVITNINGVNYYSRVNADGLTVYVDTAATSSTYMYYDENNDFVEYNRLITNAAFKWVQDTTYYKELDYGTYGAMHYVTDSTRLKNFNSFLDFKNEVWDNTYGIHARGAGFGSWESSENISTNISGLRDTVYYDYKKLLNAQGVNINTASQDEIINAVENIIVDELALETSFEGNRFTDLVRIAEHKNNSGINGTDWLARKIANRGTQKATSTKAAIEGFNNDIYSKLLNKDRWYFTLPTYSVK